MSSPALQPSLSTILSSPHASVDALLSLIVPPLDTLGLLPDRQNLVVKYSSPSTSDVEDASAARQALLRRQLGMVQLALVEKVWPDWGQTLSSSEEQDLVDIVLERWFIPPRSTDSGVRGPIIRSSYAVLSSLLSRRKEKELHQTVLDLVTSLLVKLSTEYSLEDVYLSIFTVAQPDSREEGKAVAHWEGALKDVLAIPVKVANVWGARGRIRDVPVELLDSAYRERAARSYVGLLLHLSLSTSYTSPSALALPIASLSILPALIPHLLPPPFPASPDALLQRTKLSTLWREILAELATREQRTLVRAFVTMLQEKLGRGGNGAGMGWLIGEVVGSLSKDDEVSNILIDHVLRKDAYYSQAMSSVLVRWIQACDRKLSSDNSRVMMLEKEIEGWTDLGSIKNGSDASRFYQTTLLLLLIYSLPVQHSSILALSRSTPFIHAISAHLGLLDPTTRLSGMLVAEIVSSRSVLEGSGLTVLSFGDIWDTEGREYEVIRELRDMVQEKPATEEGWEGILRSTFAPTSTLVPLAKPIMRAAPAIVAAPVVPPKTPLISIIPDPSDLQPYPLPAPPSTSYLETLSSADASLYSTALHSTSSSTTRKMGKLRSPVYIPELVDYLKGKSADAVEEGGEEESERVEVGLREGAALIRRKVGWGMELEENAVDLMYTVVGLQDAFEIEGFEQSKASVLVALIVCCPTLVAPAVIEQYFIGQYSISQRYTILSSLALAVRELAGLPVPLPLPATPSQPIAPATIDLFPSKRLPPNLHRRFIGSNAVEPKGAETIDAMTSSLTDASLSDARSTAEESIPEAARESLLSLRSKRPASRSLAKPAPAKTNFSALSSAYFLSPLINHFWSSLQSSSLSPSASSLALLHPIVLSKYFNTLTILLHASVLSLDLHRSSIPSTLELLFSLRSPSDSSDPVLTTASMELLLQIVQLSIAHDSGRELMRDENGWVGQVREWAAEVFEETQGEGRGGRGAAGVLLGCESVEDGWRRG